MPVRHLKADGKRFWSQHSPKYWIKECAAPLFNKYLKTGSPINVKSPNALRQADLLSDLRVLHSCSGSKEEVRLSFRHLRSIEREQNNHFDDVGIELQQTLKLGLVAYDVRHDCECGCGCFIIMSTRLQE